MADTPGKRLSRTPQQTGTNRLPSPSPMGSPKSSTISKSNARAPGSLTSPVAPRTAQRSLSVSGAPSARQSSSASTSARNSDNQGQNSSNASARNTQADGKPAGSPTKAPTTFLVDEAITLSDENYALEQAMMVRKLLGLRNSLHDEDKLLQAAREKHERRAKELDDWANRVRNAEQNLKKSMAKFEGYVQDNDHKRTRAETLCKETIDINKQLDKDIDRCRKEIMTLERRTQEQKRELEQLSLYGKFLEEIVETHTDFTEVTSLIGRAETLTLTKKDLLEHKRRLEIEKENITRLIAMTQEEATKSNILQSGKIADLENQLEKVRAHVSRIRLGLSTDSERMLEKATLSAQLRNAVDYLYSRICNMSKIIRNRVADSYVDKLNLIDQYYSDLNHIVLEFKKTGGVIPGTAPAHHPGATGAMNISPTRTTPE